MSKRPALGFKGKLAFGQSKPKKPRAFGDAPAAKRPPPSALMGGFGGDEEDEAPKRPPPAALMADEDAEAAGAEVDPLDAFMSEVSQEVQANKPTSAPRGEELEDEDIMDDYEHQDGAGPSGAGDNSDDEVYATEKRVDRAAKAKEAKGGDDDDSQPTGVLPKIDHSQIEYMPFRRDFYKEHPEVSALTDEVVAAYKKELDISVTWLTGGSAPRPVQTFKQVGFPAAVMTAIEKAGYEQPSAVQAQAWPTLLSGRDVIGIAKTGSGKTASFVLPGLVHLMDQPELEKNDGPIMVVLAPTRELAAQIYTESKKFSKGFGLKIGAIYGGMSKFEQFKVLKAGVEAVVATPGRLIDLIKMKGTNLSRCTYIVLDEADRMLNMGFESQVRSIVGQVRPNRQVAMFSATFARNIEGLARDLLRDPVRITVGSVGQSNKDVQQFVEVLKNEEAKWMWVVDNLDQLLDQGQVLIFRGTKDDCEAMANKLKRAAYNSNAIHGDKDQRERDEIMRDFKSGKAPILVATDVASRGLDIRGIKNVVNFDVARDIDSHVHRIGRTGRAGDKGQAFTLVDRSNKKDSGFAGDLVRNLEASDQVVPQALLDFAMENPKFQQRQARGTGGLGFGGGGGGGRGNAHRQQTVGGLGYSGSDAGVLGKGRAPSKVGTAASVGGMAFVSSSAEEQADETFGLIPSAKQQRIEPSAGSRMGMVAASQGNDPFGLSGGGGLVQSAASARGQVAAAQAAAAQAAAAQTARDRALAAAAKINAAAAAAAAAPPARTVQESGGGDWLSQLQSQSHAAPAASTVQESGGGDWLSQLQSQTNAAGPPSAKPSRWG